VTNLLEVVGEAPDREDLVERQLGVLDRRPVLVEQGEEKGLLVREVVVHVAGGDAGRLGDVADAGGPVPPAREEPERSFEDALLRPL